MLPCLVLNIFLIVGALASSSDPFLTGLEQKEQQVTEHHYAQSTEHVPHIATYTELPIPVYNSADHHHSEPHIHDAKKGHEHLNEIHEHKQLHDATIAITSHQNELGWQNLEHQLEMLKVAIENLQLKSDFQTLRLEHELATHKTSLLHDLRQLLLEKYPVPETSSYHSHIDVRDNFTNTPTHDLSQNKEQYPKTQLPCSCAEALHHGAPTGIYQIYLPHSGLKPFFVYCLHDPHNGTAWTVVQRRQDGSIDFYRDWWEYKEGFGNLHGEFFIGLDKLHALTQSHLQELWIDMESFEHEHRYAHYDAFAIGGETQQYAMNILGKFIGDAGDSMRWHEGQKFSTKDVDHDLDAKNCAVEFTGAWWYNACHKSNLNGQYLNGKYPKEKFAKGINWHSWLGHYYSLKYVHMAIRPVRR